jgi:hypothetical protein
MSKNALVPVNLLPSATAPSTPTLSAGDSYFDTDNESLFIYNGTAWIKQNSGGYTTTVTSATLVTLTVSSTRNQFFTGSTAQNVNLPVTSTLILGDTFYVFNNSTVVVTVRSSGSNNITAQAAGTLGIYTCILITGTTAASWSFKYAGFNTVTGTGDAVLATSPTLTSATINSGLTLGTALTAANGGTSQSTYATGDIVYASGTNTLAKRTVGSTGQVLTVASGVPTWATPASGGVSYADVTMSATTYVMTSASNSFIRFGSGVGTQNVTLPVTTTLTVGQSFTIFNQGFTNGEVEVYTSAGVSAPNLVGVVSYGQGTTFRCVAATGTTPTSWLVANELNLVENPATGVTGTPNGWGLKTPDAITDVSLYRDLATNQNFWIGNDTNLGYIFISGQFVGIENQTSSTTREVEILTNQVAGLGYAQLRVGNSSGGDVNIYLNNAFEMLNDNVYIKPSGTASSGYVTTNASGLVSISASAPPTISYYTQAANNAVPLALTAGSARNIIITGTTFQDIYLPAANTMTVGDAFYITNNISVDESVWVYTASNIDPVTRADQGQGLKFTCILASGTTQTSWFVQQTEFTVPLGGVGTGIAAVPVVTSFDAPRIDSNVNLFNNVTTGSIDVGSDLTTGSVNIGNTAKTGDLFLQGNTINLATGLAGEIFLDAPLTIIGGGGSGASKLVAYPQAPSGTITAGDLVLVSAQMAGYLGMPQNAKAATGTFTYTLVASDAGKHLYYTGTPTSAALVIPANSAVAYEIGTTIVVMNDLGAATNVSISITTNTLQLAGTGTTGTRTLARFGVATLVKVTATKWIISGNGLT